MPIRPTRGAGQASASHHLAESAGLVTVVGAIQVHGGSAGHAFEASGQAALGNRLPDLGRERRSANAEGLQCRLGEAGVSRTKVGVVQRNLTQRLANGGGGLAHGRPGLGRQRAAHRDCTGLEDAGLVPGHGFERAAEALEVVAPHAGNDGQVGLDHVRQIKATAGADFHDGDVDPGAGEVLQRERHPDHAVGGLAVGIGGGESVDIRADPVDQVDQLRGPGQLAVADELFQGGLQVGGAVQAGAEAGGGQTGRQLGGDGAFAGRAADVDAAETVLRVAEAVEETAEAGQAAFAGLDGPLERALDGRAGGALDQAVDVPDGGVAGGDLGVGDRRIRHRRVERA